MSKRIIKRSSPRKGSYSLKKEISTSKLIAFLDDGFKEFIHGDKSVDFKQKEDYTEHMELPKEIPPDVAKVIKKRFNEDDLKSLEVKFSPGFDTSIKRLFSKNPVYSVPRWFRDAKFEIKMAWQRVFRGWDDSQVWSFYHFNSEYTRDQLRLLAKIHVGCPAGMCHEEGYHFYKEEVIGDTGWKEGVERGLKCKWTETLDEMAAGFQALIDLDNTEVGTPQRMELEWKIDRMWDLYKQYYFNLWD